MLLGGSQSGPTIGLLVKVDKSTPTIFLYGYWVGSWNQAWGSFHFGSLGV